MSVTDLHPYLLSIFDSYFPVKDQFSIDSITVPDDNVKIVFDVQYRI